MALAEFMKIPKKGAPYPKIYPVFWLQLLEISVSRIYTESDYLKHYG